MTKSPPEALQSVHEGPLVSVVIATYNRAHAVGRAIRSALAQTFDDFEIIVVDDGSADDTAEVVQRIEDPRIRFLRHEGNLGPSAARNTGIRASRGTYVALLDSDDEWMPDKLRQQVRHMVHAAPRVGLVYTGYERVDDQGIRDRIIPEQRGDVYQALLLRNVLLGCASTALVRTSCLSEIGLFDERLFASEDYDLWLRIAKQYEIEYLPGVLARVYLHGEGRLSENLVAKEAAFDLLAAKHRSELPRRINSRVQAHRYYFVGAAWLRRGERRRAGATLWKAVRARPTCARAWALLGLSLVREKDEACLRRAWHRVKSIVQRR